MKRWERDEAILGANRASRRQAEPGIRLRILAEQDFLGVEIGAQLDRRLVGSGSGFGSCGGPRCRGRMARKPVAYSRRRAGIRAVAIRGRSGRGLRWKRGRGGGCGGFRGGAGRWR